MLKKYRETQRELKALEEELTNLNRQLSNKIDDKENLIRILENSKSERQREIDISIERQLSAKIDSVTERIQIYENNLQQFKANVSAEFAIKPYEVISTEFTNYLGKLKTQVERLNDLIKIHLPNVDLKAYKSLGFEKLTNNEIKEIREWLEYFDNFENYEDILGRTDVLCVKLQKIEDPTLLLATLAIIVFGLIYFKVYVTIPYLIFLICTVFIRVNKFIKILRLIAFLNTLDMSKEIYESYERNLTRGFLERQDNKEAVEYAKYVEKFNRIQEAINRKKEHLEDEVRANFDYDEARQNAESDLDNDDSEFEERINNDEHDIDSLNQKIMDKQEEYNNLENKLIELRNNIKSAYENLEPTFETYSLLDEFFLGFDNKEDIVTFSFSEEALLLTYNGGNDEQIKALLKVINMLCCQTMCLMNPLAYTITVSDTYTGGAPLSAFQVVDDLESSKESKLFSVLKTSKEIEDFIKDIYEIYCERRVKILGNYEDLKEHNDLKLKLNARPLAYKLVFFYEYDYSILGKEQIQQLCRIGGLVGIVFIFCIDYTRIQPPRKKGDTSNNDNFPYKWEDIENYLTLFKKEKIFTIDIKTSVEILPMTESQLCRKVESNRR